MALEDIFRALEEQADRDIEVALAESREHAKAIREEAEREAAEARASRVADAERVAKSRSAQSLNSVRLEGRRKLAAVKDRAVHEVFDEALAGLKDVRGRGDYPEIFRGMFDEAVQGVAGEFEVWVDPADLDMATAVVAERGLSAPVKGEIATAGGLVVVMGAGRVMRRNTFEDRLGKLRGIAQAEVAGILFA